MQLNDVTQLSIKDAVEWLWADREHTNLFFYFYGSLMTSDGINEISLSSNSVW